MTAQNRITSVPDASPIHAARPSLWPSITARVGWTAAVILAAAYVVTLGVLSPLPLQDYPAHLASAVIMADLIFHDGIRFGELFNFQFLWVPYLLGDLGLTLFVEVFGPRVGGGLWLTIVFLSLPCALLFFMRVTGIAAERRLLVVLLSLYLSTDWFFLAGFVSFRLGVAITILNFALVIVLRNRWSMPLFVSYSALVVAGYLLHLTTIAFLAPAIGISGLLRLWRRTTNVRTEVVVAAPLIALYAWHFGVALGYNLPGESVENPYTWGTWYGKFVGLNYEFVRFNDHADLPMLMAFGLCVLMGAGRVRLHDLRQPAVFEMLALAVTFVAIYVALPMGYSEAWYVDVRALALISVFLILACANLPAGRSRICTRGTVLAIGLATVLAATNLIYLKVHLTKAHVWLMQYRAIIAALPVGAHVFPIYTQGSEGNLQPVFHASSFITIDRWGLMPYEFTADTANPEKYLHYVHKPYSSPETWYVNQQWRSVDWRSVASDYDYVLITKPFERGHIPLWTNTVAENAVAALLAIAKEPDRKR
jgi:hypothetical protein